MILSRILFPAFFQYGFDVGPFTAKACLVGERTALVSKNSIRGSDALVIQKHVIQTVNSLKVPFVIDLSNPEVIIHFSQARTNTGFKSSCSREWLGIVYLEQVLLFTFFVDRFLNYPFVLVFNAIRSKGVLHKVLIRSLAVVEEFRFADQCAVPVQLRQRLRC